MPTANRIRLVLHRASLQENWCIFFRQGVLPCVVGKVPAEAPAHAFGLRAGDVILTFNGVAPATFDQALRLVKAHTTLSLEVNRDRANNAFMPLPPPPVAISANATKAIVAPHVEAAQRFAALQGRMAPPVIVAAAPRDAQPPPGVPPRGPLQPIVVTEFLNALKGTDAVDGSVKLRRPPATWTRDSGPFGGGVVPEAFHAAAEQRVVELSLRRVDSSAGAAKRSLAQPRPPGMLSDALLRSERDLPRRPKSVDQSSAARELADAIFRNVFPNQS